MAKMSNAYVIVWAEGSWVKLGFPDFYQETSKTYL